MITKWGLKNFKSIREAELELAPLTIITGVNSSGKSSLLQSIAMLAQSARNKYFPFLNGDIEKGDIVNLGSYKHIFNNKADDKSEIEISFTIPLENQELNVKFGLLFNSAYKYIDPYNLSFYMECKEEGQKEGVFIKTPNGEYPDGKVVTGMDTVSAVEVQQENDFTDDLEIAKIDFECPCFEVRDIFNTSEIFFRLEHKEEYKDNTVNIKGKLQLYFLMIIF